MEPQTALPGLQATSDYRVITKSLRQSGGWSVAWGVLSMATGTLLFAANPLLAILPVLLGFFLCAEGLWLLVAPSPAGLIIDGIALMLLGLWNLALTALVATLGTSNPQPLWAILGVWQIWWGVQRARRYPRFAHVRMRPPDPEQLKHVDSVVRSIVKGNIKTEPDLIQFLAGGLWRVRLCEDKVVLVHGAEQDVLFLGRDDLEITPQPNSTGTYRKMTVRIGARTFTGTIEQNLLARYDEWKGGQSEAA